MNTEFYIYGNIKLKEMYILNSLEQIQENTLSGSTVLVRLGSSAVAFIPDHKIIRYSLDIMRQTACLVINPITVDCYASVFNSTTAVRASLNDGLFVKL